MFSCEFALQVFIMNSKNIGSENPLGLNRCGEPETGTSGGCSSVGTDNLPPTLSDNRADVFGTLSELKLTEAEEEELLRSDSEADAIGEPLLGFGESETREDLRNRLTRKTAPMDVDVSTPQDVPLPVMKKPTRTQKRRWQRKKALKKQEAEQKNLANAKEKPSSQKAANKAATKHGHGGTGGAEKAARKPIPSGSQDHQATPKRPRPQDTTPPERPGKRACHKTTPVRRFREVVADNLRMAVIDQGATGGISEEMSERILSYLQERLRAAIASGMSPRFAGVRWNAGVLRIVCYDEPSRAWLVREMRDIPQTSETNLKLISLGELKRTKGTLFVPGTVEDPKIVISQIGGQNRHLATSGWQVYHAERQETGQLLHLGLDRASADILRKENGRIFYGFGTLRMRLGAGSGEGQDAATEN